MQTSQETDTSAAAWAGMHANRRLQLRDSAPNSLAALTGAAVPCGLLIYKPALSGREHMLQLIVRKLQYSLMQMPGL